MTALAHYILCTVKKSRLPAGMSRTKLFQAENIFSLWSLEFSQTFSFPAWKSHRILLKKLVVLIAGRSFPEYSSSPAGNFSKILITRLCTCSKPGVFPDSPSPDRDFHYTVKKGYRLSRLQPGCHWPNSPWPGKIKLFPARESLVSDIPAWDWKNFHLFLQCRVFPYSSSRLTRIFTDFKRLMYFFNIWFLFDQTVYKQCNVTKGAKFFLTGRILWPLWPALQWQARNFPVIFLDLLQHPSARKNYPCSKRNTFPCSTDKKKSFLWTWMWWYWL